ncbi:hypothetical protein P7C73_g2538, partial [Tremellales sp. Uapishka_1]
MAHSPPAGLKIKGKARQLSPPSTPVESAGSKKRLKKKLKKKKSKDVEDDVAFDIVDLTFDIDDDDTTSKSTPRISRQSSAGPSSAYYTPSSFTPLSRSLVSGIRVPLSPSPTPASPPRADENGIINIEEIPRVDNHVSDHGQHFDPPGLFSTSMMPHVVEDHASTEVDLEHDKGNGLLLPSHVEVDAKSSPARGDYQNLALEEVSMRQGDETEMEGVHIVDDDVSRGVPRYFVSTDAPESAEESFLAHADQSKVCKNCKRPGHRDRDCPHTIVCPLHLVETRRADTNGLQTCPTLWRIYSYYSKESRRDAQNLKDRAKSWEREAIGGREREEWCYNCASEGHLGDDCRERRGSLARAIVDSAFSYKTVSRGPFASSSRHHQPSSRAHHRWDDSDLPHVSKGFQGDQVGRKGRDKERARMVERESRSRQRNDEDGDNWFDRRNRGHESEKRPRRQPSPPKPVPSSLPRKPFGHSHLMDQGPSSAPSKKVVIGKLSTPGHVAHDSPSDGRRKHGNAALELVSRAMDRNSPSTRGRNSRNSESSPLSRDPDQGSKSRKSRKREGEQGEERDWEGDWRRG